MSELEWQLSKQQRDNDAMKKERADRTDRGQSLVGEFVELMIKNRVPTQTIYCVTKTSEIGRGGGLLGLQTLRTFTSTYSVLGEGWRLDEHYDVDHGHHSYDYVVQGKGVGRVVATDPVRSSRTRGEWDGEKRLTVIDAPPSMREHTTADGKILCVEEKSRFDLSDGAYNEWGSPSAAARVASAVRFHLNE